jgi:hypothetical protein
MNLSTISSSFCCCYLLFFDIQVCIQVLINMVIFDINHSRHLVAFIWSLFSLLSFPFLHDRFDWGKCSWKGSAFVACCTLIVLWQSVHLQQLCLVFRCCIVKHSAGVAEEESMSTPEQFPVRAIGSAGDWCVPCYSCFLCWWGSSLWSIRFNCSNRSLELFQFFKLLSTCLPPANSLSNFSVFLLSLLRFRAFLPCTIGLPSC